MENFSYHRWVIGTFSKFCLGIQVLAHSQKTVDVWSFQLNFQKVKRSLWDKFAICRSPNWRLQERFIKDLSTWIMMVVGAQLYVIPGDSQTEDTISAKPWRFMCLHLHRAMCSCRELTICTGQLLAWGQITHLESPDLGKGAVRGRGIGGVRLPLSVPFIFSCSL